MSVPRNYYGGRDPVRSRKAREFNRVAALVEAHINKEVGQWEDDTVGVIHSYEVAARIGEDSALVHDIIHGIDAGSNGVTVYKGAPPP